MSQPNIVSGNWPAPSGSPLTPTGNAKRSEKDNPYITKQEFIESAEAIGAGITATSADGLFANGGIDKAILRASTWINRYCRRWFDTQTIDEYQTGFTVKPFNPRLVSVYTRNAPIQNITGIWIQVLQWFIEVQTTPLESSYLQILPDWGIFKIVPMLSTAGSGTGSPIPAAILDKVPLGVLWYSYTFGFGQVITSYTLDKQSNGSNTNTVYQVSDYNYQLWAPDQTINVYVNGVLKSTADYSLNCPNGIVTFNTALGDSDVVTADFTTNNTIPAVVKYATILLTIKYLLGGLQNPMRYKNMSITGFSISFGDQDEIMKEIEDMLKPFRKNQFTLL